MLGMSGEVELAGLAWSGRVSQKRWFVQTLENMSHEYIWGKSRLR